MIGWSRALVAVITLGAFAAGCGEPYAASDTAKSFRRALSFWSRQSLAASMRVRAYSHAMASKHVCERDRLPHQNICNYNYLDTKARFLALGASPDADAAAATVCTAWTISKTVLILRF